MRRGGAGAGGHRDVVCVQSSPGHRGLDLWRAPGSAPQLLRRDAGALRHRRELRPDDLRVADAAAAPAGAAAGAGEAFPAADDAGVAPEPLGDELRVLDEVAVVADDAGHERLAGRQLDVLPDLPLVVVAGGAPPPGVAALPAGSLPSCQPCHSWSWRGFAASME